MMKKITSEKVFSVCNVIFLLVFAITCVYPFYYMLIYSFSNPSEAYKITILPVGFTLDNYRKAIEVAGIGRATIVSVLRTVIGTVVTVSCCSFFGYLVTKQRMVGRKLIYRLLVVTMYVDGGLIPTYMVMNAYGLNNSYWMYILPTALSAYNVMLIKTFTEQLPPALEESAMIDGAGAIRCWRSVVLPLSKPILATIAVFSAVAQWNAWFDAHIYIIDSEKWSLQYVLYRFLKQVASLTKAMEDANFGIDQGMVVMTPDTVRMTITAMVTLPILFVYPFMQRYFMKGMLLGAVKG